MTLEFFLRSSFFSVSSFSLLRDDLLLTLCEEGCCHFHWLHLSARVHRQRHYVHFAIATCRTVSLSLSINTREKEREREREREPERERHVRKERRKTFACVLRSFLTVNVYSLSPPFIGGIWHSFGLCFFFLFEHAWLDAGKDSSRRVHMRMKRCEPEKPAVTLRTREMGK